MKNLVWMLLMISASQAIAQPDDALSETNVNNQEPSFFESLFGSDQNTDDNTVASSNDVETIDGELINAQLKSLLLKQEELSSSFEIYKKNTGVEIKILRQLIDENSSKTVDIERKLSKDIKDSIVVTNRSIQSLEIKHNQFGDVFRSYKNDTEKDIQILQQSINSINSNLEVTTNTLGEKVENTEKEIRESVSSINEMISEKILYWLISILLVILLVVTLYIFSKKQMSKNKVAMDKSLQETRKTLEEEHVSLDSKLIEIIESQLKIINNSNDSSESDHALALKVADEIVRIQKNIARMDMNTKGLKQLVASVTRIQDNFSSNGYEIVDMLDKPYNEGLKASVNFIADEDLDEGESIITRIIKPQVNYQGTMIQSAQIEVSQGE